VTNAVNLLDGLDGLAGGVVSIIASSMLVFSIWRQDFHTVLMLSAAVGACLGFLRKNWAPAQIYLGDAGSLTLGFILAIISIRSSIKAPAAIAILVPILALGLPVIDTLLVMLFRFTKRARGRPMVKRAARMFRADRSHLHHLLVRLGLSRQRIVLLIYIVAAAFCSMALVVATSRDAYLGMVLVGLEILVVFGMRQMGLRAATDYHGLKTRIITD
jgi:UDP-GlcNAc:undecaprenyl-phosphate GlcNAc-1-phosphate transferase